MPAEGVTQVHLLALREKSKKTLTFTNTSDEDPDVLYTAIEYDEGDVDPTRVHYQLAGVDREDKDDAHNDGPEQGDDKDSEDKEDNDSGNDDNDRDDAPETKHDGWWCANVNKQKKNDAEPPGVSDETPKVDEAEEIPGVDDAKEPQWVDNEAPEDETESDKIEVRDTITERTSGRTNLRRQPWKEYNNNNYNNNVFSITDKT